MHQRRSQSGARMGTSAPLPKPEELPARASPLCRLGCMRTAHDGVGPNIPRTPHTHRSPRETLSGWRRAPADAFLRDSRGPVASAERSEDAPRDGVRRGRFSQEVSRLSTTKTQGWRSPRNPAVTPSCAERVRRGASSGSPALGEESLLSRGQCRVQTAAGAGAAGGGEAGELSLRSGHCVGIRRL